MTRPGHSRPRAACRPPPAARRPLPWRRLVAAARRARANAYAPYSHFAVGAALLTADGTIVTGANVENSSYGLTICAERSALVSAVAAGHRRFRALALVAGRGTPASPCGACRQVLHEFAPDLPIRLVSTDGRTRDTTIRELLPLGFGHADLRRGRGRQAVGGRQ
jgi:cytidine deaminase